YLAAKKAVDDASLNLFVWATLGQRLASMQRGRVVEELEIGAGTGTMIERLLDADFLTQCRYTVVEREPDFVDAARARLELWSAARGFTFHADSRARWQLCADERRIEIDWITADALGVAHLFEAASFDLLIGHALIDLLPVPRYLPEALGILRPGGICYFSLNFAGKTEFLPQDSRDQVFVDAYYGDMAGRFPGLDWTPSLTGRALGPWLRTAGYPVLAEGDSDWNVTPGSTSDSAGFI